MSAGMSTDEKVVIRILDRDGKALAERAGDGEAHLYYQGVYQRGDRIEVIPPRAGSHLRVMLDDAMGWEQVFLMDSLMYVIPFDEAHPNLSAKAFAGDRHLLSAMVAQPYEVESYRNLARNIYDQGEDKLALNRSKAEEDGNRFDSHGGREGAVTCFPHASSNIETRGEAVFTARCAIDGLYVNDYHGEWPWTSWGLDIKEADPYLLVDFGREIETDAIRIHLRADFPHDNWWTSLRICFSDGTTETVEPRKTAQGQLFSFSPRRTSYVKLDRLIRCEQDPSEFPALMQLEVLGREGRV